MVAKIDKLIQEEGAKTKSIRGDVLDKCLDIELFIDGILSNYFSRHKAPQRLAPQSFSDFIHFVLHDPRFNFGFKIDILRKIKLFDKYEGYPEMQSDLKKISEIRNKFAHRRVIFGSNERGELTTSLERNEGELKKLYEEFCETYERLHSELLKILKKVVLSLEMEGRI